MQPCMQLLCSNNDVLSRWLWAQTDKFMMDGHSQSVCFQVILQCGASNYWNSVGGTQRLNPIIHAHVFKFSRYSTTPLPRHPSITHLNLTSACSKTTQLTWFVHFNLFLIPPIAAVSSLKCVQHDTDVWQHPIIMHTLFLSWIMLLVPIGHPYLSGF